MIGMSQIRKRLIYGILIGAAIGVIGIATNIIIVRICIIEYKDNNNERKTFFTKEELERFKRESKECDKYAK